MKIGFIGIGNMGAPMACNIAKKGFELKIFDADPARAEAFAERNGVTSTTSLAELATSDAIVTMLPTGKIVREVLLEAQGGALAAGLRAGSMVIDMSSSEPVGTRELGTVLRERGVFLIDAPVSGGVPRGQRRARHYVWR